jgi:hypothetical protein
MHERTCIVVIPDAINNDINNINSDMDNDSMNSDGPLEDDESNTPQRGGRNPYCCRSNSSVSILNLLL